MYRSLTTALSVLVLGPAIAAAETPPRTQNEVAVQRSTLSSTSADANRRGNSAAIASSRTSAASSTAIDAESPEVRLRAALHEIWSGDDLRDSTTAIYVADARTGEPLFAVRETEKLNPASNVKLIATATALDVLGSQWTYTTRILGPRPDADGTVAGGLYLRGEWDPTLRASHLPALAASLYRSGVRRITAGLYVGVGADTAIYGVRSGGGERDSIANPILRIRVTGAPRPGGVPTVQVLPGPGASWLGEDAAELAELAELIDIDVQATTIARTRRRQRIRLTLRSELVEGRWRVTITGQIPTSRRITYRRRAPDGGLFTGQLLELALRDAGIETPGDIVRMPLTEYITGHQDRLPVELANHQSASLGALVKLINKRSRNRLADQVIMTAGAARFGGPPTMDKGVQAMSEWMRARLGTNPGDAFLDTGSGLSYQTELSARHIVATLRVASGLANTDQPGGTDAGPRVASVEHPPGDVSAPAEEFEREELQLAFRRSLAVGGVDGTLKRRFRRSRVRRRVIGKTGTLTRVIALAGIVKSGQDNAVAFAIVSNGHAHKTRRAVRKQHERMVEAMYRYLLDRVIEGTDSSVK